MTYHVDIPLEFKGLLDPDEYFLYEERLRPVGSLRRLYNSSAREDLTWVDPYEAYDDHED